MITPDMTHYLIACSTCTADAGSRTSIAANMAIFVMLGCLVLVLGSIGMFIRHLNQRGKADAAAPTTD